MTIMRRRGGLFPLECDGKGGREGTSVVEVLDETLRPVLRVTPILEVLGNYVNDLVIHEEGIEVILLGCLCNPGIVNSLPEPVIVICKPVEEICADKGFLHPAPVEGTEIGLMHELNELVANFQDLVVQVLMGMVEG